MLKFVVGRDVFDLQVDAHFSIISVESKEKL